MIPAADPVWMFPVLFATGVGLTVLVFVLTKE